MTMTWRDVLGQEGDLKLVTAAMDTDGVDMSSYGDVETWLRGESAHILGQMYDASLDYHALAMGLVGEINSVLSPEEFYEPPDEEGHYEEEPPHDGPGEYDPWPAYGPEGDGE